MSPLPPHNTYTQKNTCAHDTNTQQCWATHGQVDILKSQFATKILSDQNLATCNADGTKILSNENKKSLNKSKILQKYESRIPDVMKSNQNNTK